MSALGANRTCRDGRNDVSDPEQTFPERSGGLGLRILEHGLIAPLFPKIFCADAVLNGTSRMQAALRSI